MAGRARAGPGAVHLVGGAVTSLPGFYYFGGKRQPRGSPDVSSRARVGAGPSWCNPGEQTWGRARGSPGTAPAQCSVCPACHGASLSSFPTLWPAAPPSGRSGAGPPCTAPAPHPSPTSAHRRHPSPQHQAQASLHGGCTGGFSLEGRFGTRIRSQESEPCVWTFFRGQRLVAEKAYVGGGATGQEPRHQATLTGRTFAGGGGGEDEDRQPPRPGHQPRATEPPGPPPEAGGVLPARREGRGHAGLWWEPSPPARSVSPPGHVGQPRQRVAWPPGQASQSQAPRLQPPIRDLGDGGHLGYLDTYQVRCGAGKMRPWLPKHLRILETLSSHGSVVLDFMVCLSLAITPPWPLLAGNPLSACPLNVGRAPGLS